jgi:hypothetical protein
MFAQARTSGWDAVEVVIVSVRALADALIERLNPELPGGCWLERGSSEDWGGVWLSMHTAEGSWGDNGIANLDQTISEDLVPGVVEMALSAIQDAVAHATNGTAWPSEGAEPLPSPWARVENGALSFGYGSRSFATDVRLIDLAV